MKIKQLEWFNITDNVWHFCNSKLNIEIKDVRIRNSHKAEFTLLIANRYYTFSTLEDAKEEAQRIYEEIIMEGVEE